MGAKDTFIAYLSRELNVDDEATGLGGTAYVAAAARRRTTAHRHTKSTTDLRSVSAYMYVADSSRHEERGALRT